MLRRSIDLEEHNPLFSKLALRVLLISMMGLNSPALAEQMMDFENWEVHYSVFTSMFLTPEVASQYGITRARDRAVVTISVLNPEAKSVAVDLVGSYRNQLSQEFRLQFKKIDGDAVYYVATLRFTDREILRFNLIATLPQGNREINFQQKMYVDR